MKILFATGVAVALAAVVGTSTAVAAKTCFGAAVRDPKKPCTNPTLSVTPTPANVNAEPGTACTGLARHFGAPVCAFGAPASKARRKFALLGDSHSLHWRAALDIVGKVKRWRGFSISAGGCHYTKSVKYFISGPREACEHWNRAVLRWIRAHPEISTVFVTQNSAAVPLVRVPDGVSNDEQRVRGFQGAWRALPAHVEHVVVIRDNPVSTPETIACVQRVWTEQVESAQTACKLQRSVAVRRDMAVDAAKRLRSRRYQYIDMTPYFCDRTHCFPVLGGALVNIDTWGHISQTFSRSLAPYVLRRLRWLTASW